ncbi:MAG: ankyrin repeat domain-containing protein [Epsilonproteobacteria bacterium]|nr:ankyrin repeat domain-containing protein [Campylobacterota bacterium]NPA64389.1 ankyrin repeat domain-containing protein [Campylobacterota bacterium]
MNIFEEIRRQSVVGIKKALEEIDDLNALRTESGDSALRVAIKSGADMEVFVFLVESGADIFEVDEEGVGLIDDAIKKGRLDIVKFLVERGIDPNSTKRKSGFTPLMAAMAYGDEPITKYLLHECGVDPTIKDTFDKTAADYAKMTGYKHLLRYLEER